MCERYRSTIRKMMNGSHVISCNIAWPSAVQIEHFVTAHTVCKCSNNTRFKKFKITFRLRIKIVKTFKFVDFRTISKLLFEVYFVAYVFWILNVGLISVRKTF